LKKEKSRRITRGLRFRLTLGYAVFFTLLLAVVGIIFSTFLDASLTQNVRDNIDQEWAAMKGFLQIKNGMPEWSYDRDDPDENFIVARLRQMYLLTDAQGSVLQSSDLYASLGEDTPDEVRAVLRSREPTWKVRKNTEGVAYLIRSGVVYSNDKPHDPFFVAIGRSLADKQRVMREFTQIYVGLMPIMIFGGCLLGWIIAGRALTPVTQVAKAAQRISGQMRTFSCVRSAKSSAGNPVSSRSAFFSSVMRAVRDAPSLNESPALIIVSEAEKAVLE